MRVKLGVVGWFVKKACIVLLYVTAAHNTRHCSVHGFYAVSHFCNASHEIKNSLCKGKEGVLMPFLTCSIL